MAVNLKRRLELLERVAVPGAENGSCAACGYVPEVELKFEVSFGGEPIEGPDACQRCGQPMILRLEFDQPPARRVVEA